MTTVGSAFPLSAKLLGSTVVNSGSVNNYVLKVTYSDSSVKLLTEGVKFSKTNIRGTLSSDGIFVAPYVIEDYTFKLLAEFKINEVLVSDEIYVTVSKSEVENKPNNSQTTYPKSIKIIAPREVLSGDFVRCDLNVHLSDGTTKIINSASKEIANWSSANVQISNKGTFIAPETKRDIELRVDCIYIDDKTKLKLIAQPFFILVKRNLEIPAFSTTTTTTTTTTEPPITTELPEVCTTLKPFTNYEIETVLIKGKDSLLSGEPSAYWLEVKKKNGSLITLNNANWSVFNTTENFEVTITENGEIQAPKVLKNDFVIIIATLIEDVTGKIITSQPKLVLLKPEEYIPPTTTTTTTTTTEPSPTTTTEPPAYKVLNISIHGVTNLHSGRIYKYGLTLRTTKGFLYFNEEDSKVFWETSIPEAYISQFGELRLPNVSEDIVGNIYATYTDTVNSVVVTAKLKVHLSRYQVTTTTTTTTTVAPPNPVSLLLTTNGVYSLNAGESVLIKSQILFDDSTLEDISASWSASNKRSGILMENNDLKSAIFAANQVDSTTQVTIMANAEYNGDTFYGILVLDVKP